jgi:hypothetical protein
MWTLFIVNFYVIWSRRRHLLSYLLHYNNALVGRCLQFTGSVYSIQLSLFDVHYAMLYIAWIILCVGIIHSFINKIDCLSWYLCHIRNSAYRNRYSKCTRKQLNCACFRLPKNNHCLLCITLLTELEASIKSCIRAKQ